MDMKLQINGEARELEEPMTIAQLIEHLKLDGRQVAVERNRELVRKTDFGDIELLDGDELEIVTFVGGG